MSRGPRGEWAKHLRPYGKRLWWHRVRAWWRNRPGWMGSDEPDVDVEKLMRDELDDANARAVDWAFLNGDD